MLRAHIETEFGVKTVIVPRLMVLRPQRRTRVFLRAADI
jgi:hypothetical protein